VVPGRRHGAADFPPRRGGLVPLTRLCGISLLTAGAPAGIQGPGRRFATEAQLAAYAGVALLEASSAGGVRHRLNRGGNRRLNAILYRVALTQAKEAFRAPKRFLIRAIWRLWQQCLSAQVAAPVGVPA
jgi:transposase